MDTNEMRDFAGFVAREISPVTGTTLRQAADEIDRLRSEVERLTKERDVWSGLACKEEQADDAGPCGACRHCLPSLLADAKRESDATVKESRAIQAQADALRDACAEWLEIDSPRVSLAEQRRRWPGVNAKMRAALASYEGTPGVGTRKPISCCLGADPSCKGGHPWCGPQDDRPTCPTCGSPDPKRHPAMGYEGEVQPCRDPYHAPDRPAMSEFGRLVHKAADEVKSWPGWKQRATGITAADRPGTGTPAPLHHLQVDEHGDLWIHLDAGGLAPKASINLTAQPEMSSRNYRADSIVARGIKAVAEAMRAAPSPCSECGGSSIAPRESPWMFCPKCGGGR